jgi:hypothetical protein
MLWPSKKGSEQVRATFLLVGLSAVLVPGQGVGQEREPVPDDWSNLSFSAIYGRSQNMSSAFSSDQICPRKNAEEYGLRLSYRFAEFASLDLAGVRITAPDGIDCINGLIHPPDEGAHTIRYTYPAGEMKGYPFTEIRARIHLRQPIGKKVAAGLFGGMGFVESKDLPLGTAGASADLILHRFRFIIEYAFAWYRPRFEHFRVDFLDYRIVDQRVSKSSESHWSSFFRVGVGVALGTYVSG